MIITTLHLRHYEQKVRVHYYSMHSVFVTGKYLVSFKVCFEVQCFKKSVENAYFRKNRSPKVFIVI